MAFPARRNKHRIDVACGYSAAAFGSMTLHWLAVALLPPAAALMLTMTGVAGLFGLLRAIRMPPRFKIVPAAALFYILLMIGLYLTGPDGWSFVVVAAPIGLVFSTVTAVPTARLLRHEFGKPIPAWVCQDCGYHLFGLQSDRCPECGSKFDPDKVPDMPGGAGNADVS